MNVNHDNVQQWQHFYSIATTTMWQPSASIMEANDETCDNSIEINSDSDIENVDGDMDGNPRLADALGKVLQMTKKKTKNKTIILSKAKLYGVNKKVKKETCGFEIAPNANGEEPVIKEEEKEEEDVKPDIKEDKKTLMKNRLAKHEKLKRGRVIPNVLDKEKERQLSRIATRGVVQLFNAVRQHQTSLEKQLKEKKLTETKKEKILKSIDRKAFMNALSDSVRVAVNNTSDKAKSHGKENETDEDDGDDNEKPSWEVLRNDFMMDAKLKDWDKKPENDEDEDADEELDDDDDDNDDEMSD